MPEGQIIRAVSGFYYVRTEEGDIQCRARGVFKKKKWTPLVGDWVEFESTGPGEGVVTHLHPRKTELLRPPMANVSQAVVVASLEDPAFQQELVDRFLVHAEEEGLRVLICLTKWDLVKDDGEVARIQRIYESVGYSVLSTSIRTGEGIEKLKEELSGRLSVLAGQSGVGKSSLLNAIHPGFQLQTGEVSRKLGRGRHTTRHVEILDLPSGGKVADTPGFSQLAFREMEPVDLGTYFPEIRLRLPECRFRGCLHLKEPHCQVRVAVEQGEINRDRYRHYLNFLQEIHEQRRY